MSKILVANWKTYIKSFAVANGYVDELLQFFEVWGGPRIDLIICPPDLYLADIARGMSVIRDVYLGSQDVAAFFDDVCTGACTAAMKFDMGCKFAIIGHSEVRAATRETNQSVSDKVSYKIRSGMTPIVCIGESADVRNSSMRIQFLIDQLIESVPTSLLKDNRIIIAYEPIWAIGTGNVPLISEVVEIINAIKSINIFKECEVLYGGSVTSNNAAELMNIRCLNGLLIGKASSNIEDLINIYKYTSATAAQKNNHISEI